MRSLFLASSFLFFLLMGSGCSADHGGAEPPGEVTAQSITGGTATSADPGVVPLLAHGQTYCTGTLVRPYAVVTAAHCLADVRPDAVMVGRQRVAVTAVISHPDFDPASLADDLAVLVLDAPQEAASTTPIMNPTLADRALGVGSAVRLVGYGKATLADTVPQKRAGMARVASLEMSRLLVAPMPAGPCEGDSGGPAFVTFDGREYLAGVVSAGDPTCAGLSQFTRVDHYASWLATELALADSTSRVTGAPCLQPDSCDHGTCYAPPDALTRPYCTRACTNDDSCPSSMRCENAQCIYPGTSPGALGAPCAGDDACESTRCASTTDATGTGTCAALCVEDFTTCGVSACRRDARHPGQSACLPDAAPTSDTAGCSTARTKSDGALAGFAMLLAAVVWCRRRHHDRRTNAAQPSLPRRVGRPATHP